MSSSSPQLRFTFPIFDSVFFKTNFNPLYTYTISINVNAAKRWAASLIIG